MKIPEHIAALPEFQEAVAEMRECMETARQDLTPDEYRRYIDWLLESLGNELLPATERFARRPVYERYLARKHHIPLEPPTEAERADAILILRDTWEDDLSVEATRILDEAGR
jgi:hypothetical protein